MAGSGPRIANRIDCPGSSLPGATAIRRADPRSVTVNASDGSKP